MRLDLTKLNLLKKKCRLFLYIFHASNYIQFAGDLIEIYKFRVHYITLLHGFEMEMVYIVGMSPCHAHMFNDTVDMIRIVINTFFSFLIPFQGI